MKTEEDEAFDDLARRQGGGFPAKRRMAADKHEPWNEDEWRKNNWRCHHGWLRGEQCEICNASQPVQESEILTIVYQSGYHDGKKAALAGREWNFCERCGKRTNDIHTCTPPQEGT
jgi:hypothetical protein